MIGQKDSQQALRHRICLLNVLFSQLVFYRPLQFARNVKNKGKINIVVPNLNTHLLATFSAHTVPRQQVSQLLVLEFVYANLLSDMIRAALTTFASYLLL